MNKEFNLEFCTKYLKFVNPILSIYMAFFIRKIKKFNPQFLQFSRINIYNKHIFNLANFIFYLEKPVAPVYLYLLDNNDIILKEEIIYP